MTTGHDRVRHAVAATRPVPDPGQPAPPPRADDQQVIGGVGKVDEGRAGLAAHHDALKVQAGRDAPQAASSAS